MILEFSNINYHGNIMLESSLESLQYFYYQIKQKYTDLFKYIILSFYEKQFSYEDYPSNLHLTP